MANTSPRDRKFDDVDALAASLSYQRELREATIELARETGQEARSMWPWTLGALEEVELGYSVGLPVEELRLRFEGVSELFLVTQGTTFLPGLWASPLLNLMAISSFAALFDDVAAAPSLIEIVEKHDVNDFLIDSFIGSLVDFRAPSAELQAETIWGRIDLKTPPLYLSLRDAAKASQLGRDDDATAHLVGYVEGWFEAHRQVFDWQPDRVTPYRGYWAWEAAAAAKVFEIDDSSLRGHRNYPWDLRHHDALRPPSSF